MLFGLDNAQALAIIAPVIGGLVTTVNYLSQFDKSENSRIAASAESERWESAKKEYGRLVSAHVTEIQDTANLFIDITDPENSAEAMDEAIDDTHDLGDLCLLIQRVNQPKKYNSYCHKGAEWAPWMFLVSLTAGLVALVEPASFYASIAFLIVGLVLTTVFLYYRSKLNGLADEVQFRV